MVKKQTTKNKKVESEFVLIKVLRTTRSKIKKKAKEHGMSMTEYTDNLC